ncbi:hypothetical protein FOC1_g10013969 [Fusarium oxysporum f. sp. cubense race 1]|uniref:Methyltransferase domain-containing protein n=2 Tax=Fusarium oxysporum TaxID=5507 RepID=N4TME0_FUSC1|nr:hypothetical protein FOC1_g10013969 [Fusarium oxysporum f. sp. cubense race 1]
MIPENPLPFNGNFSSPEEYIDELLKFVRTSETFQILCGGVHILDFFTIEPGLFHYAIPKEWHAFILSRSLMEFLDLLMRDDLDNLKLEGEQPPASLIDYIRTVRSLSLGRSFTPPSEKLPVLPRSVAVGMNVKKTHEVTNFADYLARLSEDISSQCGYEISHYVDFAVEGRENNVTAARGLDVSSGLAVKPKVMRNKKLWTKILEARGPDGRLETGDLADVIAQINPGSQTEDEKKDLSLMAMSIHSCGNLSHFGIRSLVLNPDIRAVAIVGCCYNLMTEKLGPPTYKHAFLRPTLQAVNGRLVRESEKHDPQGFPMSQKFSAYQGDGVRLNITARMMACQAPQNWTEKESAGFFSRHFYRAVLQKMFLDRGVVKKVRHTGSQGESQADTAASTQDDSESPFDISTNPVIIGSLRKSCYGSFKSYVRGAVEKLTTNNEYKQYADVMQEKMGDISDEEIERYEALYMPRKKELCAVWSLMAFSAMAVESLIVSDRWTFLKEHDDLVRHAWVETVFDYEQSPRNLVVVGVKR